MNIEQARRIFLIPAAILAAGFVLAVAIYIYRQHNVLPGGGYANTAAMRPVTSTDHLLGSPSAPVKLVEYADIDSPYSKEFQQTMEQLMTEYAAGGKVAWVYRHFPFAESSGYGEQHAEAAECAESIGTPQSFYRFIDALNSAAPGDTQFDPENYDSIISLLGLPVGSFEQCMQNHTFQDQVATDSLNAAKIGASGTPYSILLIHGQNPVPVSGALPYASMKQVIDKAISQAK